MREEYEYRIEVPVTLRFTVSERPESPKDAEDLSQMRLGEIIKDLDAATHIEDYELHKDGVTVSAAGTGNGHGYPGP